MHVFLILIAPIGTIGSKIHGNPDLPTPEGLRNKSKNSKSQSLPKALTKPKAKCLWSGPRAISQREMGYRTRIQAQGDFKAIF